MKQGGAEGLNLRGACLWNKHLHIGFLELEIEHFLSYQ